MTGISGFYKSYELSINLLLGSSIEALAELACLREGSATWLPEYSGRFNSAQRISIYPLFESPFAEAASCRQASLLLLVDAPFIAKRNSKLLELFFKMSLF
jgi:hypothetical protein